MRSAADASQIEVAVRALRLRRVVVPVSIVALSIVALVLIGCRAPTSENGGAKLTFDISDRPTTGQPTRVAVTLADAAGAPLEGATVEVEGNMSHAGMVPVIARAVDCGGGSYVVEDFAFTMGGDWIMTVRATLADGKRVESSFDVRGVGSGNGSAVDSWGLG